MAEEEKKSKETCGIVMPISELDGCSEKHWIEVREVLSDVIETAGLSPKLVSDSDDAGIIQKRIVQNLYSNPIVICDVSAKNPNVMFELGMRLAFDRPTIIIKDDKTDYSFDTAPIEHLEYPRDLRFSQIVDFKSDLVEKIKGTLKAKQSDSEYTTFLGHFGTFHTAEIATTEVSTDALVLEEIQDLRRLVSRQILRPNRRHKEFNPNLILTATTSMKQYARERGWRSKASVRENREKLYRHVMGAIDAPTYFPEEAQYQDFFENLFKSIY